MFYFIFYFINSETTDSFVNHFDGYFAYLKTFNDTSKSTQFMDDITFATDEQENDHTLSTDLQILPENGNEECPAAREQDHDGSLETVDNSEGNCKNFRALLVKLDVYDFLHFK